MSRERTRAQLRCPHCGAWDVIVLATRGTKAGDRVRRRHRCRECGNRFSSDARIVPPAISSVADPS